MTLPNAIVTRRRDDVTVLSTPAVDSGTPADADYPPRFLVDDNPAHVAKITRAYGTWVFPLLAQTPISVAAFFHHNFREGLPVYIAGGTFGGGVFTFAWGATIPVPAWLGAGTRRWPVNPWLDITDATPLFGTYDPAGYDAYALVVGASGPDANDQNLELGQVKLYRDRLTLDPDVRWGMDAPNLRRTKRPLIRNTTRYDIETKYAMGTVPFSADAQLRATDDLTASLEDHWHDAGGAELPWTLIQDGQVNRCYLVEYTSEILEIPNQYTDWHDLAFSVKERGRGLRPGI